MQKKTVAKVSVNNNNSNKKRTQKPKLYESDNDDEKTKKRTDVPKLFELCMTIICLELPPMAQWYNEYKQAKGSNKLDKKDLDEFIKIRDNVILCYDGIFKAKSLKAIYAYDLVQIWDRWDKSVKETDDSIYFTTKKYIKPKTIDERFGVAIMDDIEFDTTTRICRWLFATASPMIYDVNMLLYFFIFFGKHAYIGQHKI